MAFAKNVKYNNDVLMRGGTGEGREWEESGYGHGLCGENWTDCVCRSHSSLPMKACKCLYSIKIASM